MISVELGFMYCYHPDNFSSGELSIWTDKTGYNYYPLSYSIRECLELICERLGWGYEQYEMFDDINGRLQACKPEPKIMDMVYWCNGIKFPGDSVTDGRAYNV